MAVKPRMDIVIRARDRASRVLRAIGKQLGSLRSRLLGFIGLGALAAGANAAMNFARSMKTLSEGVNLTTTEFQALLDIGRQFNLEADDISDAMFTILQARNEAMKGDERQRNALEALGFTPEFLSSRENPLDYMLQLAHAVKTAKNEMDLLEPLSAVMGEDNARRFLPLLQQGPQAIARGMLAATNEGRVQAAAQLENAAELARKRDEAMALAMNKLTGAMVRLAEAAESIIGFFSNPNNPQNVSPQVQERVNQGVTGHNYDEDSSYG